MSLAGGGCEPRFIVSAFRLVVLMKTILLDMACVCLLFVGLCLSAFVSGVKIEEPYVPAAFFLVYAVIGFLFATAYLLFRLSRQSAGGSARAYWRSTGWKTLCAFIIPIILLLGFRAILIFRSFNAAPVELGVSTNDVTSTSSPQNDSGATCINLELDQTRIDRKSIEERIRKGSPNITTAQLKAKVDTEINDIMERSLKIVRERVKALGIAKSYVALQEVNGIRKILVKLDFDECMQLVWDGGKASATKPASTSPYTDVQNYVKEVSDKLKDYSGFTHITVVAGRSNDVGCAVFKGRVCAEESLAMLKKHILHSPLFPRAPCPLIWQIEVDKSLPIPGSTWRDSPSHKVK